MSTSLTLDRGTHWPTVAVIAIVVGVLSPFLIMFEIVAAVLLIALWLTRPSTRPLLETPLTGLLIGCMPYLALAFVSGLR